MKPPKNTGRKRSHHAKVVTLDDLKVASNRPKFKIGRECAFGFGLDRKVYRYVKKANSSHPATPLLNRGIYSLWPNQPKALKRG